MRAIGYHRAMPIRDFNAQRLYFDAPLAAGARLVCTREQANYLLSVLRLKPGDGILVFNGRDGEWSAVVAQEGRREAALVIGQQTRPQVAGPDIAYLFAPLKRARLDYMVQKATELGVARLSPVMTRRTQAERVNLDRMRANAVEAAEQCGILNLPQIDEPRRLEQVIADWDPGRRLVFCDEGAEVTSPLAALAGLKLPTAVLIGPEGGFDEAERALLLGQSFTLAVSLGPRVMRADTAAVAALALVNAISGDWR